MNYCEDCGEYFLENFCPHCGEPASRVEGEESADQMTALAWFFAYIFFSFTLALTIGLYNVLKRCDFLEAQAKKKDEIIERYKRLADDYENLLKMKSELAGAANDLVPMGTRSGDFRTNIKFRSFKLDDGE